MSVCVSKVKLWRMEPTRLQSMMRISAFHVTKSKKVVIEGKKKGILVVRLRGGGTYSESLQVKMKTSSLGRNYGRQMYNNM